MFISKEKKLICHNSYDSFFKCDHTFLVFFACKQNQLFWSPFPLNVIHIKNTYFKGVTELFISIKLGYRMIFR